MLDDGFKLQEAHNKALQADAAKPRRLCEALGESNIY